MLKTEKIKTHVLFPSDILKAVDKITGLRKRSKFIVEATREKLEEIELQQALETASGCWSDKSHPDLMTQKDINVYLKKTRELTEKRIKRFSG